MFPLYGNRQASELKNELPGKWVSHPLQSFWHLVLLQLLLFSVQFFSDLDLKNNILLCWLFSKGVKLGVTLGQTYFYNYHGHLCISRTCSFSKGRKSRLISGYFYGESKSTFFARKLWMSSLYRFTANITDSITSNSIKHDDFQVQKRIALLNRIDCTTVQEK